VQFAGRLVGVLHKLPPLPSGLNLHYQLWLLTPISLYLTLVWHLNYIEFLFFCSATIWISLYVCGFSLSLSLLLIFKIIIFLNFILGITKLLQTRPDGLESLHNETNETIEQWIAPSGAGSLLSPLPILMLLLKLLIIM
jgi:hypothetical protein